MFISLVLFVAGLTFLVFSANKLVEASSNLALSFGISKLVIGLTIVAAGTSLPEFVVGINSAIKGNPQISLGNVVGSNIVNIILILGVTALINPINSTKSIVKREVPIMIAVSGLVWLFSKTNLVISPREGVILLFLFVVYCIISFVVSKQEAKLGEEYIEEAERVIVTNKAEDKKVTEEQIEKEINEEEEEPKNSISFNIFCIIGGLIGLTVGSEILVKGSIDLATAFGINSEVIGLTIIAIGTSLPELATSVVAAKKGQSDIAIGNVLGSNIFNLTVILGATAIVPFFYNNADIAMYTTISKDMLSIHIPIMMIAAVILLPITITDMKISRYEGAFFLIIYICYSIMVFQMINKEKENQQTITIEESIQNPASSTLKLKTEN